MNYELAKKLREAGWPVNPNNGATYVPTLSELIKECEYEFSALHQLLASGWQALSWVRERENGPREGLGETPEEAVANLWLKLQNHE